MSTVHIQGTDYANCEVLRDDGGNAAGVRTAETDFYFKGIVCDDAGRANPKLPSYPPRKIAAVAHTEAEAANQDAIPLWEEPPDGESVSKGFGLAMKLAGFATGLQLEDALRKLAGVRFVALYCDEPERLKIYFGGLHEVKRPVSQEAHGVATLTATLAEHHAENMTAHRATKATVEDVGSRVQIERAESNAREADAQRMLGSGLLIAGPLTEGMPEADVILYNQLGQPNPKREGWAKSYRDIGKSLGCSAMEVSRRREELEKKRPQLREFIARARAKNAKQTVHPDQCDHAQPSRGDDEDGEME